MVKFIGYSLSRCVVDILDGIVPLEKVDHIEARTDFDPENQSHRDSIWRGYTELNNWSNPVWIPYKTKRKEIEEIYLTLHRTGRLRQPRRIGNWPERKAHHEIWKKVE